VPAAVGRRSARRGRQEGAGDGRGDAGAGLGQGDDGIDDDGDQLTDCADPDCNGKTCMSGTVCVNLMCPGPG
jgi:hypothetical protein